MINADANIINAIFWFCEAPFAPEFRLLPFTKNSGMAILYFSGIFIIGALYAYSYVTANKHDNLDTVKGSTKWNDDLDGYNKTYTSPKGQKTNDGADNMVLSQNVFLSMNTRNTLRNCNILTIGGSGAGKSRFFVKPNLLQGNCSYIVTDPSGELLESTGHFFQEMGYKVKVFNLVDMQHSCCYNPFDYIRDDLGVVMLVNCLIKNTTPEGASKGDPFWEKSETALLQAIIFYLLEACEPKDRHFTNVMRLLTLAEVSEQNPNLKSPLDKMFEDLEKKNKNSMAVKQYKIFKMGAGKTLKSILISCAVRLTAFNMEAIANLTRTDVEHPENNIDLGSVGDEKQIIYVIIPSADDTFNFLVSLMYSQLFETLYFHAETECPSLYTLNHGDEVLFSAPDEDSMNLKIQKMLSAEIVENENGCDLVYKEDDRPEILKHFTNKHNMVQFLNNVKAAKPKKRRKKALPIHVRFMLDEFANIGEIPQFTKKLATMRKYEISCSIILQNMAQIKTMYKDDWGSIVGNCDTLLFLGGQEYDTLEYISKALGDVTIVTRNKSQSKGKGTDYSFSYNRDSRKLMMPEEIGRLGTDECLVIIRGEFPFRDKKYDYPKHPQYSKTGDATDENIVDYKTLFDNRKEIKQNEEPRQVIISQEKNKKLEQADEERRKLVERAKKDDESVIGKPKVINNESLALGQGGMDAKAALEESKRRMEESLNKFPKAAETTDSDKEKKVKKEIGENLSKNERGKDNNHSSKRENNKDVDKSDAIIYEDDSDEDEWDFPVIGYGGEDE